MSSSSQMKGASGVHDTVANLKKSLKQYIEAQYHIRNEPLVEERNLLLEQEPTIVQSPYVEATQVYKVGNVYSALDIPKAASSALTQLADLGVGLYPRPYEHQTQALNSFLGEESTDIVVATGTGSGKTESFLMPIIGNLAIEGEERPDSANLPGCRAMLLYPMNALVNDQLSRIRRLLGDPRAAQILKNKRSRPIRFGSYTGRTPYPGSRSGKKDEQLIKPLFENFYSKVIHEPEVLGELEKIGRWPSKDLEGFYASDLVEERVYENGKRKGKQYTRKNWKNRLNTQPGDRELMTRHEIQQECPELLITNYSMLEYMLMRPIERGIFEQTRDWLKADPSNEFVLVIDEAHMYRGTGGAEVALLIRRLCARLEIPRERMRCILTSASLGTIEDGVQFACDLTGLSIDSKRKFKIIQGTSEERRATSKTSDLDAEALAEFDLTSFQNIANDTNRASIALESLAERLGWQQPPETDLVKIKDWLYHNLTGYAPLEELISQVSGKAVQLESLSQELFKGANHPIASKATDSLLALGCYAKRSSDGRVLLPTRLHLFHRGLPGLFACIDTNCSQRLSKMQDPILGRLYTKSLRQCSCESKARVYELFTHRDCGAAFIRGYVSSDMNFLWHESNGPLVESGAVDLMPVDILVEDKAHPRSRHKDMWLHVSSGKLLDRCPPDPSGYRKVCVPDKVAAGEPLTFDECPVCMRNTNASNGSMYKIMDHVTKGEAPFTTLVRTQMSNQPASRVIDSKHPNGGRKVLIFSDGRQKAARLARDIPRDIELDVFRQAIALACVRLQRSSREARPNNSLYLAFLSVLSEHDLSMFDGRDAAKIISARDEFYRDYEGELDEALQDNFEPSEPPPSRYKVALLKLLCGNYYSLMGTTVGFIKPTAAKSRRLKSAIQKLNLGVSDDDVVALSVAWIDSQLTSFAFDSSIDSYFRYKAAGYSKPGWGSRGCFDRTLREGLIQRLAWTEDTIDSLEETFRQQLASKHGEMWFLSPNSLVINIDLSHVWTQCSDCTSLMPLSFKGNICLCCGSNATSRIDPSSDTYITARKGFWRSPVEEALEHGARLSNLSVEEHTAQLSNRDRSSVHSTTELYELRFQDVLIHEDDRPIDVLSCTTTMEVGVDIGSLTAVSLRNVPPQRENYQQRAGRAGRRGSSVSTVVTYCQNGPHDSHYFLNPEKIVAGPPRTPEVKVDNAKIAMRHVHSYLIQTFFQEVLDTGTYRPSEETSILEKALGKTRDFFFASGDNKLDFNTFDEWVNRKVLAEDGDLRASILSWLPVSLETGKLSLEEWLVSTASRFIETLRCLADEIPNQIEAESEDADETLAVNELEQEELLDFLFFHDLLPSYAFPTSLSSFLVEALEKVNSSTWKVKTIQRPQQDISKALSEYAPGRLIVIDKYTYRSGGVFADMPSFEVNRARPLFQEAKKLVYCEECSFVRDPHATEVDHLICPVCSGNLQEETMIQPEVFGPENAKYLPEEDREQEITFATMAQFPQPVNEQEFVFRECGPNASYTHAQGQRLVTVNRGKSDSELGGFSVCVDCGAAKVFDDNLQTTGEHERPYKTLAPKGTPKLCSGEYKRVLLGHDFKTDLLLIRLRISAPLITDTSNVISLHILEDALHSVAEALRLAASRHRQLDVDPAEFGSGFRVVPALQGTERLIDLFLYDTLSGGAGYAEIAAKNLDEILRDTLSLLEECECDTSCTDCLNHFHNQHIQNRLDRRLGASLLRYVVYGEIPEIANHDEQAMNLSQLCALLELDGYKCVEGKSSKSPILVEYKGKTVTIGSYPGLLDRSGLTHAVLEERKADEVMLINEYLLKSNQPEIHLGVRTLFTCP
ncbi:DEAD/DEAH box helicase [Vibrio harveyi]|uniref:DEAD/DEAH box helicase n=1 Tax=Vibrio harveyi TaxID=669 RepID=UPI003CE867E6